MRRFSILLFCVWAYQAYAQQSLPHVFDETALQFKVAQIDEFMHRFNYDVAFDGSRPVSKQDTAIYMTERIKNMATVFNLEKFGDKQHMLDSLSLAFCHEVIDSCYVLDYKSGAWYAKVTIECFYAQKKHPVALFLRPEQIKDEEYKWVIYDVEASILNLTQEKDSLIILPSEHGVGFVSLAEKVKLKPNAVNSLFVKDYRYNRLSVFSFLVSRQLLRPNSVKGTMFHFDVGDYSFDVERIERTQNYNSGWLINTLIKH